MIHTGTDLLKISRIAEIAAANRTAFLNRICTKGEIARLQTERRFDEKLAGLYALKEAFAKALGTGIGESLSFTDLEVSYSPKGAPLIAYIGERHRYLSTLWNISCSLSHDGDMVVAIVIIEGAIE